MGFFKKSSNNNRIFRKYLNFGTSVHGWVVIIITALSVFLFVTYNLIFRSVYDEYIRTAIRQNGNNIGSIVEGSLYQSMLENDKTSLQNTLDVINTMSGIDDVNLYNSQDSLVYSSFNFDTINHGNPNCKICHENLKTMFPLTEKSYHIIESKSNCGMNQVANAHRYLLIKSPVLNEKSCYTAMCHAHSESDKVLGSLVIKVPLTDLDKAVKKTSTRFFLFAIFTTLLLVFFIILFTRVKIRKPLASLKKASEAVASGDMNTRLKIKNNELDDMRMVSLAFNKMLDNLQSATKELENWSQQLEYKVQKKTEELGTVQGELMQIERIASLGKLASSVAHEINNPLSGILVYTKLIYKQLSNPELYASKKESILKHLRLIENETKRCGEIVKGLLEFSRKDQENFENNHLQEILQDTYDLMTHPIEIANINFRTDFKATSDLIFCNPYQIKQACVAILVNASEAVHENGEITIKTFNPDNETIKVEISDNGTGISPEDIPHIFEPFFTTKHDASGIGLGLPIVHGIIQNHNAKIDIKSTPGIGTTMSLTFNLIKYQQQ